MFKILHKYSIIFLLLNVILFLFYNGTLGQDDDYYSKLKRLSESSKMTPNGVKVPAFKGATIAHVHVRGKGYGSGSSKRLFKHFKGIGINSIQLNTFVYQPDVHQPQLYSKDNTLRLSDLRKEIISLHKHGFKVYLKPHLWPGKSWKPTVWRDKIDLKNKKLRKKWFDNYWQFLKQQIQISIEEKVAIFAIGTELSAMSKYSDDWIDLIQKIRDLGYTGLLSYAALAYNAPKMKFWHKLDVISLNFYYPYKKHDESGEVLRNHYAKKMLPFLKFAKKMNKEIYVSELGFPSHQNAILKPWSWPEKTAHSDKAANFDLQSKGYTSLLSMLQHSSIVDGVWVWKYITNMNSYEKQKYTKGFNLENKPAEVILSQYYRGRPIKVK